MEKNFLLRQVAAHLEVDTALISKIERGERKPSREQVLKLAEFLKIEPEILITAWLADKISYIIENEEVAEKALKLVLTTTKKL
jgi:transcriptional regulator with XRE-family HTH domain